MSSDEVETWHVRQQLAQDRRHAALVRRVGVGVQEADRDRLDARSAIRVDDRGDVRLVERRHDLPW